MATSKGHNLTEYYDDDKKLEEKLNKLVELVKNSKHLIVFTGAGISTAAKIPDFRGPNGVWTCKDQGRDLPKGVSFETAEPTIAHMSLVKLQKEGILKFVISQNVDGLHLRSGLPSSHLAELHGNCFLEKCWNCNSEYLRTMKVSDGGKPGGSCNECLTRVPYFCHCTKRKCKCGSRLKDSVIHFKENLPEKALKDSIDQSNNSDLCICLGSSLLVSPACKLPLRVKKNGGKVVIVNLQETGGDEYADLIIHSKVDQVMSMLMDKLDLNIPKFEWNF